MLRVLKRITVIAATTFFLTLYFAAGPANASDKKTPEVKMNDISGVLNEAQKKAKELQLPDNDQTDDCGCQEATGKLMEKFNAPDFQAKIRAEQQRLQETLFNDILTESSPQGDPNTPAVAQLTPKQLYLFISSSVQLTTLRNYAAMIDRAPSGKIIMVLRGFIDGMKKIRPTMEFIGEILKKDPACDLTKEKCNSYQVNIQVDPLLCQRFTIEKVPTLAYLPVSEGDAEGKKAEPIIVNGDASLDYLLEQINREAKSADLNTMLAALRGGINNGE